MRQNIRFGLIRFAQQTSIWHKNTSEVHRITFHSLDHNFLQIFRKIKYLSLHKSCFALPVPIPLLNPCFVYSPCPAGQKLPTPLKPPNKAVQLNFKSKIYCAR